MRTNQMIEYLKSQKEQFEKIKKEAEARIQSAPEGTVSINRHKKGLQFYIRTDPKDKNGSYLPVAEKKKHSLWSKRNTTLRSLQLPKNSQPCWTVL